jgi:hypothetical protein
LKIAAPSGYQYSNFFHNLSSSGKKLKNQNHLDRIYRINRIFLAPGFCF